MTDCPLLLEATTVTAVSLFSVGLGGDEWSLSNSLGLVFGAWGFVKNE